MAQAGHIAVSGRDVCSLVRSWPLCEHDGDDHVVVTHCQMPNGSLIKVRIRQSGDGWVVSDGGAALDEAIASGVSQPAFGLNVRRTIRDKGLSFNDGRIETPRIGEESLFNGIVVIANAARDIAETLIYVGSAFCPRCDAEYPELDNPTPPDKLEAENAALREAGQRLAFAAGALNIATDSMSYLRGERGNVLDALKGWQAALREATK